MSRDGAEGVALSFGVDSGTEIRLNFISTVEPEPKDISMLRKIMLVAAITAMALSATACKTVKGVGGDIKSVGEAGSDAIHK